MTAVRVGDVLRVTCFRPETVAAEIGPYPLYAVVTDLLFKNTAIDFLVDPEGVSDNLIFGWTIAKGRDGDEFTTVPLDEVPDEILRLLARRALT